jgi:hypothetical protein
MFASAVLLAMAQALAEASAAALASAAAAAISLRIASALADALAQAEAEAEADACAAWMASHGLSHREQGSEICANRDATASAEACASVAAVAAAAEAACVRETISERMGAGGLLWAKPPARARVTTPSRARRTLDLFTVTSLEELSSFPVGTNTSLGRVVRALLQVWLRTVWAGRRGWSRGRSAPRRASARGTP